MSAATARSWLFLAALLAPLSAGAQTLTTLYKFTGTADGEAPIGTLVYENGTLYGAAELGGTAGAGTVFSLNPATGALTLLHNFAGGTDGAFPTTLVGHNGMLYGTTIYGGKGSCQLGCGTVFAINAATGAETILYAFSTTRAAPAVPVPEGLLYHGGQLYGTTVEGANTQCGGIGCGTVFKINPATGAETTLHTFTGGPDGGNPVASPIYEKGTLYVTTESGGGTGCGGGGCGTIVQLDAATGAEAVLFSFTGGITGGFPAASLLQRHGVFYTTTLAGVDQSQGGVIAFNPATGAERVLHSFTGLSDGALPLAGVTAQAGILYGTTFEAGSYTPPCKSGGPNPGCGTLFGVDAKSGAETVLHTFNWKDGSHPGANLIYANGAFYGSTSAGGRAKCPGGCGTLFTFVP